MTAGHSRRPRGLDNLATAMAVMALATIAWTAELASTPSWALQALRLVAASSALPPASSSNK